MELPAVQKVTLEQNKANSEPNAEPSVDCSEFELTPELVKRYLDTAHLTNENDAHHTLDYSPCFASGVVTFADGREARFRIQQLRMGHLAFKGGEELTLYCRDCDFAPFLP